MFDHILLVDDSLSARMIIRQYLEIVGCAESQMHEAKNGREALEALSQESFDLIVTDMNMPVMDGNEFLRRLKASPKYHNIPVIIISSAVNEDNQKRFMKFGVNHVIGKPVSPHVLHEAIVSLQSEEERS